MSVFKNNKKWRSVKINGRVVRKIYHNGKIIFDYSKQLKNPIVGPEVFKILGSNRGQWVIDRTGWYRCQVAASAGGNSASSAGAQGGNITIALYLLQGWRVLAWGATARQTGAPAELAGGNGSNGYNAGGPAPGYGILGGGGRSFLGGSGGGGGGAGGFGGTSDNYNAGQGGGGAAMIIYSGDDLFCWRYLSDPETGTYSKIWTKTRTPGPTDKTYNNVGMEVGQKIKGYDSATDSIIIEGILGLEYKYSFYSAETIYAAYNQANWLYLILAGGGGGAVGTIGITRYGGGGGGAGGFGGGTSGLSGGDGQFSKLPGIPKGADGVKNSAAGAGAAAVIYNRTTVIKTAIGGMASIDGFAVIRRLS